MAEKKTSMPEVEPNSDDTPIHYVIKDWRITCHKGEFPRRKHLAELKDTL